MNLDDMKCWEYSMAVDPNEAYVTREVEEEQLPSDNTALSYQESSCCGGSIYPDVDMNRWEFCDNSVILANAEYYYTKEQTDKLVESVSGMSPSEVQDMINRSIITKADKSTVDDLAETVRQQGIAILNTYTKEETNNLLDLYLTKLEAKTIVKNYASVDGDVLTLNNQNIE